MDTTKILADLKKRPGFTENVGREMEQQPGIFCIHAEAVEGELKPGDDVLFLVVAGDIREHVKATFSELLDRIKAEAVIKQEFTE